jgi:hypothetical protein
MSLFNDPNILIVVGVPFINTIINPAVKDYKSVYVEDRNQYMVSASLTPIVEAQVSELTMTTDSNILPFAFP